MLQTKRGQEVLYEVPAVAQTRSLQKLFSGSQRSVSYRSQSSRDIHLLLSAEHRGQRDVYKRQELAVTLNVGEVFMDVVHEYPDLTVHLTLFHAAIREGVPQKLEHNDIRWITVDEIDQFEFCPADEEILIRLKQSKRRKD